MSARRFVPFSSPAFNEPVRTVCPLARTAFEMITPSTTYSGSMRPRRDEAPRICTWPPPPGAPLFMLICAPITLPCSALSSDGAGTRVNSSALTVTTAVAAFRLSTLVAAPVTVTPSSCNTSRTSAKFADCASAAARTSCRLYPSARAWSVTAPPVTRTRNSPRSFERAPACWPNTVMVASGSGAPLPLIMTRPEMSRDCASTVAGNSNAAPQSTRSRMFLTGPPKSA